MASVLDLNLCPCSVSGCSRQGMWSQVQNPFKICCTSGSWQYVPIGTSSFTENIVASLRKIFLSAVDGKDESPPLKFVPLTNDGCCSGSRSSSLIVDEGRPLSSLRSGDVIKPLFRSLA